MSPWRLDVIVALRAAPGARLTRMMERRATSGFGSRDAWDGEIWPYSLPMM
jgi:hypothetical protein